MNDELYELVTALVHGSVTEHQNEVKFRNLLLDADEDTRTEVAWLVHDLFNEHGYQVALYRVERYMAHRMKVAEWHIKHDELFDELDELMEQFDDASLIEDEDGYRI